MDGYTLARIRFYGAAIDRARRRRDRETAIILRAAHHYDADDFREFVKERCGAGE